MTPTPNRIRFVVDHIEASYPCSMQSVVNWCLEQGLEEACGAAITSMLMDKHIELYVLDDALIISPAFTREAHECNIDVAQRELDRRSAEGEDVSLLAVCQRTAQIVPVVEYDPYDDREDYARCSD